MEINPETGRPFTTQEKLTLLFKLFFKVVLLPLFILVYVFSLIFMAESIGSHLKEGD
jgi:hypothetical protein